MAYAQFDDNGYIYYNEKKHVLFRAGNAHIDLFNYVSEDLTLLPKLLEKHFLQRIDSTTFKQKSLSGNTNTLAQIEEAIKAIHPYYSLEYRKIILNAIGKYFNELLVYLTAHSGSLPIDLTLEQDWYIEQITHLMSPLLQSGETYHDIFYNKYKEWIAPNGYKIEETIIPNIPSKKPIGFIDEIRTQNTIYNMLFFILDISVHDLENLTIPQRAWIYENIFNKKEHLAKEASLKCQFSFLHPILYPDVSTNSQVIDSKSKNYQNTDEICKVFLPLHDIKKADIRHNGIPQNMIDDLKYAIDYAKKQAPDKISEQYEINNLHQLLYLEILSMMQSNSLIRKCKNCDRYFLVKDRKVTYCDRIDSSGMQCSAIGPRRSFKKRMEQDEALRIYIRAYKTRHARVRKKKMSQNDFEKWCTEAKNNLERARNGKLDISDFQKWLKK